jgi:DNA-binding response OmpR family regulator
MVKLIHTVRGVGYCVRADEAHGDIARE